MVPSKSTQEKFHFCLLTNMNDIGSVILGMLLFSASSRNPPFLEVPHSQDPLIHTPFVSCLCSLVVESSLLPCLSRSAPPRASSLLRKELLWQGRSSERTVAGVSLRGWQRRSPRGDSGERTVSPSAKLRFDS